MEFDFDFEDKIGKFPEYEEIFKKVYEFLLKKLCKPIYHILSLSLIDEEESLYTNKTYRGKDYVADVITFAYLDDKTEEENEFFVDLGDIMICPAQVKKRADEIGNDFQEEMIYLFIHGFLHILGYDHVNDEEEARIMFNKQDELFNEYMKEYYNDWSRNIKRIIGCS